MSKFYHLESYEGDLFKKISSMANHIMNKMKLVCKKRSYRIVELECYFKSSSHPDPFVHGDDHQKVPGCWYFHRQNGKGYKNGTFKGLDITFGSTSDTVYGGMLIRSIMGETLIEGPCNVVNELLRKNTIAEFVTTIAKKAKQTHLPIPIDNQQHLTLVPLKKIVEWPMTMSPRVGLSLKGEIGLKYDYWTV